MKISQKRKEKKERKERLYRPRTEAEHAARRRAALYGLITVFFCLLLIVGAVVAITLSGEAPEEVRATSTEATEPAPAYTVVIDPGHGGGNIGQLLGEDLAECDLTMSLAEDIAELLRADGCRVIFTRTAELAEP
ncbi:MAG: N-acetylmuramoyl-L-alanine amidase, partial [Clostridia bacterium]|nr:N-acetylmuramoyl-L-alanine amidase [Clostridia bacterium]